MKRVGNTNARIAVACPITTRLPDAESVNWVRLEEIG